MDDMYENYMRDLALVYFKAKPIVVIEARKSHCAYTEAIPWARKHGLFTRYLMLADSKGEKYPALAIAQNEDRPNQLETLLDERHCYTRRQFQIIMGNLMGYKLEDCIVYVNSRLSRTCGCELCGGATPETRLDDEAHLARTVRHV